MNGLHAPAPWWLLALVDLVVGGLCLALALRPRRRRTTDLRRPAGPGAPLPTFLSALAIAPRTRKPIHHE